MYTVLRSDVQTKRSAGNPSRQVIDPVHSLEGFNRRYAYPPSTRVGTSMIRKASRHQDYPTAI